MIVIGRFPSYLELGKRLKAKLLIAGVLTLIALPFV